MKTTRAKGTRILNLALIAATIAAHAHFQVLLPSTDMVTAKTGAKVMLKLLFTHPMEQGPIMEMDQPHQFGVLANGTKKNLLGTLRKTKTDGKTSFTSTYTFDWPGDRVFFLEPAPYWEPAEQKMIIHYTKVVVNGYGDEDGWDEMVGMPVEIMPLVRPYGLWTGNAFRGVVTKAGKPVPFAEIEVEFWNEGGAVSIPADPFITQVIKADANGTFTYTMPRAGWWAFAALVDGDKKIKNPAGKLVDVELGALMWVQCVDMK